MIEAASNVDNPTSLQTRRAALAALLMGGAALAAWQLTPTRPLATQHGELELETQIPKQFGDWRVDSSAGAALVNPQQDALLKQIYTQILTRTYVNSVGQRVMLSIAYGNDQRDGMQLHYPEVCYPAQGFQLRSNRPVELSLAGSSVPARRLETVLGGQRYEPVTYWTVIGDVAVRGGMAKKLVEMRYGFSGLIPDGLLFRVSTIGRETQAEFAVQQAFAETLLVTLPLPLRARLAGKPGTA